MDYTDDYYYADYAIARRPTQPPPPRRSIMTRTFVIGVAAMAVLLGFSLGLYSSDSLAKADSSTSLYNEKLVTTLFEDASPAVVEVTVTRSTGRLLVPRTGTGSGFIIDADGHILTNYHVVEGADEIAVNLSDSRTLSAQLLGYSKADDLALLEVKSDELGDVEPLPLADSDDVKPGQMAIAIGSPFRNFNSVTVGIVSGTGRGPTSAVQRPIPDMIQTDAPLNPGNSGGPLLNSRGEVIGVNSAVRTGNFQGLGDYRIGFAVPSNTIKSIMPELLMSEQVRRPWLGISGGPISRQLSETLGISQGIVVTSVLPRSPAEQAGLVPFMSLTEHGDVITAVDGKTVTSVEDMVSYFNSLRPGKTVTLSVFRHSDTIKVEVTLAEWPDT